VRKSVFISRKAPAPGTSRALHVSRGAPTPACKKLAGPDLYQKRGPPTPLGPAVRRDKRKFCQMYI